MATATAAKTAIWAPSRPKSVDPSLARSRSPSNSQSRPPLPTHTSSNSYASFSSFSSSFMSSHARTSSGSNGTTNSGDKNANSKWIQRSMTPGPLNSHSRARSGTGSSDMPPPLPSSAAAVNGKPHHRRTSNASSTQPARPSSTAPENGNPSPSEDNWKARIHQEGLARFKEFARVADAEYVARLRSVSRSGFRPDTPTGSSQFLDDHLKRMQEDHQRLMADLQRQMEEDVATAIRREERRRRRLSRSERDRPTLSTTKGVVVEEDDSFVLLNPQSPGAEQEEWLWRPDELDGGEKTRKGRRRGSEDEKSRWKEAIRQEQQVIWNASTARNGQGPSPPNQSSSGINRKVHWANGGPPPTGRSGSPALPPQLPYTPHTATMNLYHGHARPMSAAPTHSHSQQYPSGFRPISPAVAMARPGSARPSSPAFGLREREREREAQVQATGHARWIPSVAEGELSMKDRQRSAARPIPGKNVSSNYGHGPAGHAHDAKDSEGSVGSGSVGSWRDWKGPAVPPKDVQPHSSAKDTPPSRRAMTPAPGMTSSASKYAMAQNSGAPPVPGTARMRTLSFNAPQSNMNTNVNAPTSKPAPTIIPSIPAHTKGKSKSSPVAVVDDRDDPEDVPPAAAVLMTRSSSGLPESDEPPPEQAARRKDKGKGKAPAPPAMETGRGSERERGVYSIYAAQLEDFATVLRRELSIASEA